jgi:acetyl-CoA synthetase
MVEIYREFCEESFDKNGVLNKFELRPSDDFNFGYDVVDTIAKLDPDRRAMEWCNEKGEERTFTFGDISRLSNKAANVFLSRGIKKGDMVLLILKRNYQFWYIMPALHKIGAVAIPATNLLTKKDLVYRFNTASVSAVVCTNTDNVIEHVKDALQESPTVKICFSAGGASDGFIDFDNEVEKADDKLDRLPTKWQEPFLLYFTSGTTGLPKMVIHNHSYAIAHIITAKYWHNVVPDGGLHFTVAETGWGKAVWGKLYGQWFVGAAVFTYDFDRFVPSDVLKMIEKHRVTTFCAPPTIYRFFIKEGLEGYDLSSLQYATTAGEALNPEVFKRFYELTGLKLMEGFGQTETTLLAANLVGSESKPGSMGKPLPLYNLELVDDDGKPVKTGEIGEIAVRAKRGNGAGLFMGYYLDDSRTSEAWYDGLYHTGDTAWYDEDGYLWYVGRKDDIIKASGYRIGPFEIESVLMEHPSVLECAVTGAADPIRGTVIKATIVLAKGWTKGDELAKEIQDYVKTQTAPYKYPRIIEFVEELPKTISGKIMRTTIRNKDQ